MKLCECGCGRAQRGKNLSDLPQAPGRGEKVRRQAGQDRKDPRVSQLALLEVPAQEPETPQVPAEATCGICEFAKQHGWWGPRLSKDRATHCSKCHRTWRGEREGHCSRCCRHFGDQRAFDAHLTGGRCHAPVPRDEFFSDPTRGFAVSTIRRRRQRRFPVRGSPGPSPNGTRVSSAHSVTGNGNVETARGRA